MTTLEIVLIFGLMIALLGKLLASSKSEKSNSKVLTVSPKQDRCYYITRRNKITARERDYYKDVRFSLAENRA